MASDVSRKSISYYKKNFAYCVDIIRKKSSKTDKEVKNRQEKTKKKNPAVKANQKIQLKKKLNQKKNNKEL